MRDFFAIWGMLFGGIVVAVLIVGLLMLAGTFLLNVFGVIGVVVYAVVIGTGFIAGLIVSDINSDWDGY